MKNICCAKVMCGTWNVNAKKPEADDDLLTWLHKDGGDAPDIFCVGFQEIVDLTTVNVVADGKTRERSAFWREKILASINTIGGTTYKLVHEKHLVGIMICIFAKEVHFPFIKRVQSQSAGVGVMGMMGNKGGAAIRFKFHDTSICVVCAHLAAHRDNVAGRNADFANIVQRVQFIHVEFTQTFFIISNKNMLKSNIYISNALLLFLCCKKGPSPRFHQM
jgi:inositol polyphosphate 5-phosphatase INPP5B/F